MESFLSWALEHFGREWSVITGAPFLFGFAMLLVGSAIFFGLRWLNAERAEAKDTLVNTKEAHIQYLSHQLEDYKQKLSGRTPEEAAEAIKALQEDVANSRTQMDIISQWVRHQSSQRRLTAEQRMKLRESLAIIPEAFYDRISVGSISEPEPQTLAMEILEVFLSAGLCVGQKTLNFMYTNTPDEHGILIVVPDEKRPAAYARLVFNAFKDAGIDVKMDSYTFNIMDHCTVAVSHKPPPTDIP